MGISSRPVCVPILTEPFDLNPKKAVVTARRIHGHKTSKAECFFSGAENPSPLLFPTRASAYYVTSENTYCPCTAAFCRRMGGTRMLLHSGTRHPTSRTPRSRMRGGCQHPCRCSALWGSGRELHSPLQGNEDARSFSHRIPRVTVASTRYKQSKHRPTSLVKCLRR